MKKQKPKVKKGTVKPPRFTSHGAGIMLEAIEGKVSLIGEAVGAIQASMVTREEMERETTEIRGAISQVQSGLEKLDEKVERLDQRVEKLDEKLEKTKQELKQEIQTALVPVNSRLDRHEEEITHLKKAQGLG